MSRDNTEEVKTPVIVSFGDLEPADVFYLWEPWLPLGKITILEGNPGIGKTWIALKITATTSTGEDFPYTERQNYLGAGNVLFFSAEDGLNDTLLPRLEMMGADTKRINAVTGWKQGKEQGMVTLNDQDVIANAIEEHRPSLVVFDPLQAFLGTADMHRANEVRSLMAKLARLAEEYRFAALLIRHLSKASQSHPLYRGMGSIDFTAAARSVMLAGENPYNPESFALIHTKSNCAKKGDTLGYTLEDGQFSWTGPSNITEETILNGYEEKKLDPMEQSKAFLREVLKDDAVPSKKVTEIAKKRGIKPNALKEARKALGVKSIKEKGKTDGGWYLELK